MKVLVTGAQGFVGTRVLAGMARRGVSPRGLVRRGLVPPWAPADTFERVRGDVTDAESLRRAVKGCDVVFHCAWGGESFVDARRINVEGTRNLLTAAAAAGVRRVVHLSTMAVHGHRLPRILTEDCPFDLHGDAYGVTKAEGELAAFELGAKHGVEVVALRPTLVYGPRAPVWLLAYFDRTRREQVALVDGGVGLANLVYVDDLVDAMWTAAQKPGVNGQAFLISGPEPVPWRAYIGAFAAMCRKPLPPSVPRWRANLEMQWMRVYGTLANRPRRLVGMDLQLMPMRAVVDTGKAQRLLGFTPPTSFEVGMALCEAWLREEGHLPPARSARERGTPAVSRASGRA
jgi:nucleoside-diphosphate-sugar epimerase